MLIWCYIIFEASEGSKFRIICAGLLNVLSVETICTFPWDLFLLYILLQIRGKRKALIFVS